jgi:hypothetical protein
MPLTAAEAHAKAQECREMAERAQLEERRTMLNHMSETWDRIAASLKPNGH